MPNNYPLFSLVIMASGSDSHSDSHPDSISVVRIFPLCKTVVKDGKTRVFTFVQTPPRTEMGTRRYGVLITFCDESGRPNECDDSDDVTGDCDEEPTYELMKRWFNLWIKQNSKKYF